MARYSYTLPYAFVSIVRVEIPAFLSAGMTWFFWSASHSLSMSGFTSVTLIWDRIVEDEADCLDCAKQGIEEASASQTTPALKRNGFSDTASRVFIGSLLWGGDEYITSNFSPNGSSSRQPPLPHAKMKSRSAVWKRT